MTVALAAPAAPRAAGLQRLLYAYAAFVFVLIAVHWTFTNRTTWGDEDGLYNAIYMFQHTGKVTYPMHLQPDTMTVPSRVT